jgi:hypothetical protein
MNGRAGGAIINASVVVIPIPGIAVAAIVVARPVISRCHTHAEAEVLSLRLRRNQSKQHFSIRPLSTLKVAVERR